MCEDEAAHFIRFRRERFLQPCWQEFETDRVCPEQHRELNGESLGIAVSESMVGRGDLFPLPLVFYPAQQ